MKNDISKFLAHDLLYENLLCAISGGQDSIVLLMLFYHLKTFCSFDLYIISCNHFWIKKNIYNEIFLVKLSFLLKIDINIFLGEIFISTEEKGGSWRRKNFLRLMSFCHLQKIALGHNSSDEIETAIWHLLRGTSSSGIVNFTKSLKNPYLNLGFSSKYKDKFFQNYKNIKKFQGNMIHFFRQNNPKTPRSFPSKKIYPYILGKNTQTKEFITLNFTRSEKLLKNQKYIFTNSPCSLTEVQVVRPLHLWYREDTKKIILENNLPIFIDKSNQSLQIIRNRIRLILLPLFRIYFAPNSDFQIEKYLELIRKEQSFFSKLNLKLLEQYCKFPHQIESLVTLPPTLKEKILHFILMKYLKRQIQKIHIESLTEFL